jgi:multisubunit Na+/H+ antiporter MnhE subunit
MHQYIKNIVQNRGNTMKSKNTYILRNNTILEWHIRRFWEAVNWCYFFASNILKAHIIVQKHCWQRNNTS